MLLFDDIGFSYGRFAPRVVDRFSWSVPDGRTVLLGPNGAGKSTLLSLAATALAPRSGRILLDGLDLRRRRDRTRYRSIVGWMTQATRAVPGLTCQEQVAYVGWLRGLGRSEAWTAAAGAIAAVGLTEIAHRPASEVSGGQLRRVALAQAFVNRPAVLLLDEPTVGLDPAQRAGFREAIGALGTSTVTLVSTHQVDDLAEVYDTIVVLNEGRVRFQGSVSDFLARAPEASRRPAEDAYASLVGVELPRGREGHR
jgi:ABC-2 type transport system ATP-binding protein